MGVKAYWQFFWIVTVFKAYLCLVGFGGSVQSTLVHVLLSMSWVCGGGCAHVSANARPHDTRGFCWMQVSQDLCKNTLCGAFLRCALLACLPNLMFYVCIHDVHCAATP